MPFIILLRIAGVKGKKPHILQKSIKTAALPSIPVRPDLTIDCEHPFLQPSGQPVKGTEFMVQFDN
jgi:hypothetical protein